jgi:hypothetical protein
MLNSPRGKDIYGHSIDWQTAKIRMLDHYQSDQINHQQELAALPYVFNKMTCEIMMGYEKEIIDSTRNGNNIVINVETNNVDWHMYGRWPGLQDMTEEGQKSRDKRDSVKQNRRRH